MISYRKKESRSCRAASMIQVQIIISYLQSQVTVQKSEDKEKQILSPCHKFAKKFAIFLCQGKVYNLDTTYILTTLKVRVKKERNRKQAQEHTTLDSFFYVICIGLPGNYVVKAPHVKTLREGKHSQIILLMQKIEQINTSESRGSVQEDEIHYIKSLSISR